MYFFAGEPTLVCPCLRVHWRKPLVEFVLTLPVVFSMFVRFIRTVFEMGSKYMKSSSFEGNYFHDLFKTGRSILV